MNEQDTLVIPAADTSLAADTLAVADPAAAHIIMDPPAAARGRGTEIATDPTALSWVTLALVGLFVIVALKFRNNFRFAASMARELMGREQKQNMFDDTMRETSFIIMLNLLCVASQGILLWEWVRAAGICSDTGIWRSLLICSGLCASLYLLQRAAYFLIGRIFYTATLAGRWLHSFSASQGLLSLALFPLAMLSVFYPASPGAIIILAFICWILARVMFIANGFRIFSEVKGNFLTFLYYLCSVEIIPALLCLRLALRLCAA